MGVLAFIDETTVSISYDANDKQLGVWVGHIEDSALVATIAQHFDEALRSGQYDSYFVH